MHSDSMSAFVVNFVLSVLIILSLTANGLMLLALRRQKKRRKPCNRMKNFFLTNLALIDLAQTLLGYGVQLGDSLTSTYSLRFCEVSGFFITMCGLVAITIYTMLSVDICFHICRPIQSLSYDHRLPYGLSFIGLVYGSIWAAAPFFGLDGYVNEGKRSCSLKWTPDTLAGKIYLISLFVACFAVPVTIIFASFACIHVTLRKGWKHRNSELSVTSTASTDKYNRIRRANFRLCFIMSSAFLAAWTPYAVVAFYIIFAGYDAVPESLLVTSAFMAKCSALINPAMYFYVQPEARKIVANFCHCAARRGKITIIIIIIKGNPHNSV